MPLLVAANALQLGERRVRVLVLVSEVAYPLPAERGRPLGVDVEPAEAPEGAEVQLARDRARHLPEQRADSGEERGEETREGRIPPPDVVLDGARPAADPTHELLDGRRHSQPEAPELEERAPDVDRVHLLVLPEPEERVPDDFARVVGERHGREAGRDDVLAVPGRDELLALEGEEQETNELAPGTRGVPVAQPVELALEVRVHLPHREHGTPRRRQSQTNQLAFVGRGVLRPAPRGGVGAELFGGAVRGGGTAAGGSGGDRRGGVAAGVSGDRRERRRPVVRLDRDARSAGNRPDGRGSLLPAVPRGRLPLGSSGGAGEAPAPRTTEGGGGATGRDRRRTARARGAEADQGRGRGAARHARAAGAEAVRLCVEPRHGPPLLHGAGASSLRRLRGPLPRDLRRP